MPLAANPIYLVPAPDMNERAVRSICLEGREIVALQLPSLNRSTELEEVLAQLGSQIAHEKPTLIGFCYGGVLALELAKRIDAERVVVVSGIKHHREIARSRKLLARVYCRLPDRFVKVLGLSAGFVANQILRRNIHIPRVWLKGEQNKFILAHALSFEGIGPDVPVTHIHGQRDALLPVNALAATHVIEGGGHFLFLGKRKELLSQLAACVG